MSNFGYYIISRFSVYKLIKSFLLLCCVRNRLYIYYPSSNVSCSDSNLPQKVFAETPQESDWELARFCTLILQKNEAKILHKTAPYWLQLRGILMMDRNMTLNITKYYIVIFLLLGLSSRRYYASNLRRWKVCVMLT